MLTCHLLPFISGLILPLEASFFQLDNVDKDLFSSLFDGYKRIKNIENDIVINLPLKKSIIKLPERQHDNDPERFEAIQESLFDVFKDSSKKIQEIIPTSIIKTIEGYDYNSPLYDLYIKVLDKLSVVKHMRWMIDFYSQNFAFSILILLLPDMSKFSSRDPFWYDLTRLLLKWAIHMKQSMKASQYESALRALKLITIIITKMSHVKFPLDGYDLSMTRLYHWQFRDLIIYECMEQQSSSQQIFHTLSSILDDFYNKNINVKELKEKYFQGSFDNDPLLKLLIAINDPDPERRLVLNCQFPDYDSSILQKEIPTLIDMNHLSKYLEYLKINGLEIIGFDGIEYMSTHILKFYLDNNRRIRIASLPHELLITLRKLKKARLLREKPLSEMIEFEIQSHSWKSYKRPKQSKFEWNRDLFKTFLKAEKRKMSLSEYNEYSDLIN